MPSRLAGSRILAKIPRAACSFLNDLMPDNIQALLNPRREVLCVPPFHEYAATASNATFMTFQSHSFSSRILCQKTLQRILLSHPRQHPKNPTAIHGHPVQYNLPSQKNTFAPVTHSAAAYPPTQIVCSKRICDIHN